LPSREETEILALGHWYSTVPCSSRSKTVAPTTSKLALSSLEVSPSEKCPRTMNTCGLIASREHSLRGLEGANVKIKHVTQLVAQGADPLLFGGREVV